MLNITQKPTRSLLFAFTLILAIVLPSFRLREASPPTCYNTPSTKGIEPAVKSGNPNSCDVGGNTGFKIEPPASGTFQFTNEDGELTACQGQSKMPLPGVTVTISNYNAANGTFNWSVSGTGVIIDKVIVKGGPAANVYTYAGQTADGYLHAPINPNVRDCKFYAISHIEFCYRKTNCTPPQDTCAVSFWKDTTIPPIPAATDDDQAVELGLKFKSNVSGYVTGIRFYKGTTNTGTHIGSLWKADGTLLAKATFQCETTSGWQRVLFSTPVYIAANTIYIASYYAPNGNYAFTKNYFSNNDLSVSPLIAPKDGTVGGNGVFKYSNSSTFPTETFMGSNYWVDVLFRPDLKITCPADKWLECGSSTHPNETGYATAPGNATITYTDEVSSNTCEKIIKRTWKAKDNCGNLATCLQKITLKDNRPPTITCPADKWLECGSSTHPDHTGKASAWDDCDENLTITYTDEVSSNTCEKIIKRTWKAKDKCGNLATCLQKITLKDNEAPTVLTPAGSLDRELSCDDEAGIAAAQQLSPTATDDCSGNNLILSAISGIILDPNCQSAYRIERKWFFKDQCGNESTFTQVIKVFDNKAPSFTVPENKIIHVDAECSYDADPSKTGMPTNLWDNCLDEAEIQVTYKDTITEGDCFNEKILTRTWMVSDGCNSKNKMQTIILKDNSDSYFHLGEGTLEVKLGLSQYPEADCPSDHSFSLEVDREEPIAVGKIPAYFYFNGIKLATPNNGAIKDKCFKAAVTKMKLFVWEIETSRSNNCWAEYEVLYKLVDNCGNAVFKRVKYRLEDDAAPYFEIAPQNKTVPYQSGRGIEQQISDWLSYNLSIVKYKDNCSSNFGFWLKPGAVTGTAPELCYNYEFILSDDCGNTHVHIAKLCTTGSHNLNSAGGKETAQSEKQAVLPAAAVNLYPNPATAAVNVEMGAYLGKTVHIRIVNSLGQVIQEVRINELQQVSERIELPAQAKGLHFVIIQSEGMETVTKKLIIN